VKAIYYFILILLVTNLGCKNDDKAFQKDIIGMWDVYAAQINNKPSGFMEDAWFKFNADATVESNVFEDGGVKNYEIKSGNLIINTKDKFSLNITMAGKDTMYLDGKLKYYYMEYFMAKRKS
jgi:hypothetical protein